MSGGPDSTATTAAASAAATAANADTVIAATEAAVALIHRLTADHGPLMFHVSGGCCDGSAPMCFAVGEFRLGARDVRLGTVAG